MTLSLHQLRTSPGSRRARRRVGRGNASRGTYSGRGLKGQRSRTGGRRGIIRRSLRSLLERVPKQRGFRSLKPKLAVVDVRDLEARYADGDTISAERLVADGLLTRMTAGVKILGTTKVTKKLIVRANAFSKSAAAAITAAGGQVQVVGRPSVKPTAS